MCEANCNASGVNVAGFSRTGSELTSANTGDDDAQAHANATINDNRRNPRNFTSGIIR
jgi:hypothetical protein